MERMCRIALVEDHTILREGLKSVLSASDDLEVVCEASDGRDAIQKIQQTKPDLAVVDLTLPRTSGMVVISELKKYNADLKVLVLTVHKSEEYVLQALRAGADGYVLKEASFEELNLAVRSVMSGHRYLSPQISSMVIDRCLEGESGGQSYSRLDLLTSREQEVLKLVAEGMSNKEVSNYLSISVRTVETHRARLMRKLDLHNAADLTTFAIQHGITSN